MWCCCLLHARATTCSATTRSGARPFATWSSHCERDLRNRMTDRQWETRLLAVLAAVLVVFGLVAVYGASSLVATGGGEVGADFALRQLVGAVVGGLVATWLARSDYHVWRGAAWPLLGVTALLLLIPLLPFTHGIAPTINGARRWVNLGVVTVQPSELAKLAAVVWTAMLAAKKGEQIRTFRRGLLPFLVILGPLVGLIFLEPNLSMALLVAILAGTVLFAAGARIGHFLLVGVGAAPLALGAVASAQYRLARVLTFLNPGSAPSEATWQVHQSLVGVGSGRLFGVGLGQGQQKLGYLPYAYSDFIFSTIGEEWGFLGVLAIVLLFGTFMWVGFRIARSARDAFGQLLAVGLTALIGFAALLHIAVSLGLLPATGITLPFISYGRSSLFVALVATGVLASVGRGRR
ncbi:MAG: stage V sporulation protein E [Gemmatimonadetes bacterium]|nr:MAG: stage V sporulation protein E [Gemmatimonadota bacterium]